MTTQHAAGPVSIKKVIQSLAGVLALATATSATAATYHNRAAQSPVVKNGQIIIKDTIA